MDKNECKAVVELLSVTWNQAIDTSSITVKAKGFWEYIEDLPYENVKNTIKHIGLSGRKWAPRPG